MIDQEKLGYRFKSNHHAMLAWNW